MSTYDPLRNIIPSDQALASKALEAGFQQIKGIQNSNPAVLSIAISKLESNTGLPLINALTAPLPQNVVNFFTQTYGSGTGSIGLLVLCDVMGTPSGWIHIDALANATAEINSLTALGSLTTLTNATTGVYTVMEKCLDGVYTTYDGEIDPGPPPVYLYTVTIPPGLPGAGVYSGGSAAAAQSNAFTNGLNPALISAINTILAQYPTQAAQANLDFATMSAQITTENTNLARAGVDFANLLASWNYVGLATQLTTFGIDIVQGGAAYFFEAIAATSTIGGQAVISTMRQARNQPLLQNSGVQNNPLVSDIFSVPLATLDVNQYTVAQATAQKIT